MDFSRAEIYDCEVLPNCFTFGMELLDSDVKAVWEISQYRDDREQLLEHFRYLSQTQTPMIGFNNCGYDYPIIHMLWQNPNISYKQLYDKSQQIIGGQNRFGHMIWASDRFAPQVDLYKINHFDNPAKSTGLKTLQINMRSENVLESSLPFDRDLILEEVINELIPYNISDVTQTKRFAHFNKSAIDFRIGLIPQFGVDVLNWNDTKIGEQMVIQRLGDEACYDRSSGRRQTRQTPRHQIALKDIIFPYVRFEHPEFNRILDYLKNQVLKADEISTFGDDAPIIRTKGVFTDLTAIINGLTYHYGVGGIHGSVERRKIYATENTLIRDIDVAALYPSIAVVNGLHPEHLGQRFVQIYSELPKERKRWQEAKGKKCVEANALKLASNGVYGKSNSIWSPFYDPAFMLTITINGQLMLSMLAEQLIKIPTLEILQINTDGLTYNIERNWEHYAVEVCNNWQQLTGLVLEDNNYKSMHIKDVNNYCAIAADGSVKLKGTYWTPDPLNYHQSISESQPPAWHKNFSNVVSTRAAVAHMTMGTDIEQFIRMTTNPYDFCCAVKVRRSDKLLWNGLEQQRNTRFYVSTDGAPLLKQLPAQGTLGAYKKARGVSDSLYEQVMRETGGAWDERVCQKNKQRYDERESQIMAGYNVRIVNDISQFDWSKINYNWYLQEALKLVI